MDDTNKLAGVGGMRFIADTNVHEINAHTIIVCENAHFANLEYANGVNALKKIHAPGDVVQAAWCTPITADATKNKLHSKGPFKRVRLFSGIIAIYNDYLE